MTTRISPSTPPFTVAVAALLLCLSFPRATDSWNHRLRIGYRKLHPTGKDVMSQLSVEKSKQTDDWFGSRGRVQPSDFGMAKTNSLGSKKKTQKATTKATKQVDDSGGDTVADDLARGMAGALSVPDQGGDYSGWEEELLAPRVIVKQTEKRGVTEAQLLGTAQTVTPAATDTPWNNAGKGACSAGAPVYLSVSTEADFQKRLRWNSTRKVAIIVLDSIVLTQSLVMGPEFACTMMRPAQENVTITLEGDAAPALVIVNTSNVLIYDMVFVLPITPDSADCTTVPENGPFTCPTVFIYRSYGIQLTKTIVQGRVQVARTMAASIDNNVVSGLLPFPRSPGAIRIMTCGNGPQLLRASLDVSNNYVFGPSSGIVLHMGAIGVSVYNNFVVSSGWAGIQCGDRITDQFDCMLSKVYRNYVIVRNPYSGTGIYFNTKFFNPGNVLACNYVRGGRNCYLLESQASGVTVRGGACIGSTNGIVVNGGKRNNLRWIILKDVNGTSAVVRCSNVTTANCNTAIGRQRLSFYSSFYNTSTINLAYPYLSKICTETTAKGGLPCNPAGAPPASQTGACSGLPTDNTLDVVLVNSPNQPVYDCKTFNQSLALNTQASLSTGNPIFFLFVDYENNNLALQVGSPLFKARPNFLSCDRGLVGPQVVQRAVYFSRFNVPTPAGFNAGLTVNVNRFTKGQ